MKRNSHLRAYFWACVTTAIALVARLLMDPILGIRIPYATFYVAVTISTVAGGAGPGVVSALLGALAAIYFFVPPRHVLTPLAEGADNQLGLALYFFVVAMLILLAEMQRRARARAEEAKTSEQYERQRFETTLGSIGDGVIATDAEGRITFMNRVAAELTGWTLPDAKGQPIEQVFAIRNEETGAVAENPVTRAIREARVAGLANHTILLGRNGKWIPIDDSGAPILDPHGKTTGAVLVFRDITEARQRNAELQRQRRMIEVSHDAIILMDQQRRITAWNRGAEEMYGWTPEEAIGKPAQDLLRTRSLTTNEQIDAVLLRAGRWDGDLIHTRKDGAEIVSASRQVALSDVEGNVVGLLEINRDITEAKRLESDLRRSLTEAEEGRRTLDAILEHLPEGLAIAEAPSGAIRMVSRCAAVLLGKPRQALLNKTGQEHASALGLQMLDGKTRPGPEETPLMRSLLSGEVITNEEWMIRRPDGTSLYALCDSAPILGADGMSITGAIVTWRDITERRQVQEKLRESAKLESLGVLAGGIAHDFNNLLTGVLGNACLIADSLPDTTAEWAFAQGIIQAAERAARLAHQMLAYSGRGQFVIEPIDLSGFIRQTADLIKSSIPKKVGLVFDLAEGLPPIDADAAQIQQLVMNLVINGAEAIGSDGGRVVVRTREQIIDEAYRRTLLFEEDVRSGDYVILEVSDDGCGMDEQTVSRIFDPFFTTKFVGRGLGLSAVQGIVRAHRGGIKVYSEPGRGTRFMVVMPARATAPARTPVVSEPEQASSGSGTVLVIDDEEVIRSTARTVLERLGYSVIVASDGSEGVEGLRSAREEITVVLLDWSMPGMSGEATMTELRKIKRDIRIVLSSGFSEAEAMQKFANQGLAGFLQKPYTVQMLARSIGAARSVGLGAD